MGCGIEKNGIFPTTNLISNQLKVYEKKTR